jgi:Uncharacterized protein conserved in bacteria
MISKSRDYTIDTLRGLMLVLMTLDHSMIRIVQYTYQPLGAFSAAEGFFYLSGFMFGLIYSKYTDCSAELWKKTFKRILIMLKFHILFFAIMYLEHIFLVNTLNNNLNSSWAGTEKAIFKSIIDFLTLKHIPTFFDVIPIYCFFFLLAPIVLLSLKSKFKYVVGVTSLTLWLISNTVDNPYGYMDYLGFSAKLQNFNPMSWQFLFVLGCYFGYRKANGQKLIFNRALLIISLIYCLAFLVIRRIPNIQEWSILSDAFSKDGKNLLSPLRIFNFVAFIYLLAYFIRNLETINRNYLAFIGAYSIYVFTFHIFIVSNVVKLNTLLTEIPLIIYFLIVLLIIWSLTIPAFLKENHKNKTGSLIYNWLEYLMFFPKDVYRLLSFKVARKKYPE